MYCFKCSKSVRCTQLSGHRSSVKTRQVFFFLRAFTNKIYIYIYITRPTESETIHSALVSWWRRVLLVSRLLVSGKILLSRIFRSYCFTLYFLCCCLILFSFLFFVYPKENFRRKRRQKSILLLLCCSFNFYINLVTDSKLEILSPKNLKKSQTKKKRTRIWIIFNDEDMF